MLRVQIVIAEIRRPMFGRIGKRMIHEKREKIRNSYINTNYYNT